jgi:tricorn protease
VVTGFGLASSPYFSPDGATIAFSANYNGNVDVYTIPAAGGQPRRLTYHPAADVVVGWSRDGSKVLFRSGRASGTDAEQIFTISADGGIASMLPLPDAVVGSYSPDGSHFAYVPNGQWEPFWQGYRGGQTTPIWIANMADSSVVTIPRNNSNDRYPMWIGSTIYFVSDRDGAYALFAYDPQNKSVRRLITNHGFDIMSASSNDGAIVYSQFDSIHVFDPASGTEHAVPITIAADIPDVRPHWLSVGNQIQNANLSPTGVRAVFEAHGDIFTVPAEHGDVRNLTSSSGVMERDPAWSPDGRSIAFFSDASGEYQLHIKDQRGLHADRVFALEPSPSFYYTPKWSPNSKRIAYVDKHLGMYLIDVDSDHPHATKFDEQPYESFSGTSFDASWSPDGRYLAYAKQLRNFLRAIFVYDTKDGVSRQVTDGLSDASSPAFDKSGKYLYFQASTDTGLSSYGLDMESDERPVSSSVYVAVLQDTTTSPVAPQTAEEPVTDEPDGAPTPKPKSTAKPEPKATDHPIDFDGILQRIVSLPIPEANYVQLNAGVAGTIFLLQAPLTQVDQNPTQLALFKFDMSSRHAMPMAGGLSGFVPSFDGKKMLLQRQDNWSIVPTSDPAKPGDGSIDTGSMETYVVPHEEWAQMYRETWRIERDYFYDPHHHGLDVDAAEKRFAVFLPGLASRDDFTYLTHEMISYLSVGHLWVSSGTRPSMRYVYTGLLGADYTVEDGRFKIAKIYDGENWNPDLSAPLTQPGVEVHVGDYLLAVNGRSVRADREVYSYFEETANKQTSITVGPHADGTGAHTVTVVPVASEAGLRNRAWIEDNRRTVDRLSGGKIGYVYLPDTEFGGFTNFNRYFFAQVGKQGVIIDERYNHGGQLADYVIDFLSRKPKAILKARDGATYLDPPLAIYGPKVMLINEYAGSGGDAMPWLFKKADIGTLVGVRTWGGLVGIGGYPPLMDGGSVMAPRIAIGGLHGQWEVEGHGVSPDIEVQQDPKLVREGHDPQLEAAVNVALKSLREHPLPNYQPPAFPNHHPKLPPK